METFKLAAVIACVAYGFFFIRRYTIEFNDQCVARFDFKPLTLQTIALSVAPVYLLPLAIVVDDGFGGNSLIALIVFTAAVVGLYRMLKDAMKDPEAMIGTGLLFIYGAGFPVVAGIFLACRMIPVTDQQRLAFNRMW